MVPFGNLVTKQDLPELICHWTAADAQPTLPWTIQPAVTGVEWQHVMETSVSIL